jgi:hypothetical protein
MEAITIEILNPKAKQLIKDLADLKLISISKPSKKEDNLKSLLNKFRANNENAPSLEEITQEVEAVRKNRYARKTR